MRTTVTLDPDVEELLRDVMRKDGISFEQAVKTALRRGLPKSALQSPRPYEQRTSHMGFPPEYRWDKVLAMADEMEDKELVRKLGIRK